MVISKTVCFMHDSIPRGVELIRSLGASHGFAVDSTEDASRFTRRALARYEAVVFLNTTGDVLSRRQQAAFEAYMGRGGGWVGVHSAADTEYAWPFYGALLGGGAWFLSHPAIQAATLEVDTADRKSTRLNSSHLVISY